MIGLAHVYVWIPEATPVPKALCLSGGGSGTEHRSEGLWLPALWIKTPGIWASLSVTFPLEGLTAPLHTPYDGDLTSCEQLESTGPALGTQTSDPSFPTQRRSHKSHLQAEQPQALLERKGAKAGSGSLDVCPRVGSNQPGACSEPLDQDQNVSLCLLHLLCTFGLAAALQVSSEEEPEESFSCCGS